MVGSLIKESLLKQFEGGWIKAEIVSFFFWGGGGGGDIFKVSPAPATSTGILIVHIQEQIREGLISGNDAMQGGWVSSSRLARKDNHILSELD